MRLKEFRQRLVSGYRIMALVIKKILCVLSRAKERQRIQILQVELLCHLLTKLLRITKS